MDSLDSFLPIIVDHFEWRCFITENAFGIDSRSNLQNVMSSYVAGGGLASFAAQSFAAQSYVDKVMAKYSIIFQEQPLIG